MAAMEIAMKMDDLKCNPTKLLTTSKSVLLAVTRSLWLIDIY